MTLNIDLESILNKVQNISTNSYSKDGATTSDINIGDILNGSKDIYNAVQSGEGSEKTANVISSVVKNVMSLIGHINEAQNARTESKKTEKETNKLLKRQEKLENQLNNEFANITNSINAENTIVTESTEAMETVHENLKKAQEELENKIQEIEAKQKELANAKPEDRARILEEIQVLGQDIPKIAEEFTSLQLEAEGLTKTIENSVTQIETAKGNAVSIQEDGQMTITELAQAGANLIQNNVATKTKGTINIVQGQAAEKAAAVASSNIFSGTSIAPKLMRVSRDQNSAGQIRTTSSIGNLKQVMQGIGKLQDNLSILSEFRNSVGNAIQTYSSGIGAWNEVASPVIESFGSLNTGTINNGYENLQNAIEEDLTNLGENNKQETEEVNTQNSNENKKLNEKQNTNNTILKTTTINLKEEMIKKIEK